MFFVVRYEYVLWTTMFIIISFLFDCGICFKGNEIKIYVCDTAFG